MLTDAGPLVALINNRDQNHPAAQNYLDSQKGISLSTACPALAEALHLLGRIGGYPYQDRLLNQIQEETLQIHHLTAEQEKEAYKLMAKYQDRPMSYADASLMILAQDHQETRIFTFDSDFRFYRLANGSVLETRP